MPGMWLAGLLLVTGVNAFRGHLEENRAFEWDVGNPNRGPDRGQPEQVHLSYAGNASVRYSQMSEFMRHQALGDMANLR